MTLARRAGTVIVLETGVYFPMLDLDRPRAARVVCFHTRAGFRWIAGKRHVTQRKLRCSGAIEKLLRELPTSCMTRRPRQMCTKPPHPIAPHVTGPIWFRKNSAFGSVL